jgi:dUTP pyrophosphatase
MVLLFNFGENDFEIKLGDRIAQFIIEKYTETDIIEVDDLDDTERGNGGFGSTGVGKI